METMEESMAILTFVGHSLAKQRKVAGLTQAELAAKSKVSRATIAAIENGAADPKLTTIIAICTGISPNAWGQLTQEMWLSHLEQLTSLARAEASEQTASPIANAVGSAGLLGATGTAIGTLSGPALGGGIVASGGMGATGGAVGAALGGLIAALLSRKTL